MLPLSKIQKEKLQQKVCYFEMLEFLKPFDLKTNSDIYLFLPMQVSSQGETFYFNVREILN